MERVGVRELRQNLSVYLRRVRRGEKLEVTERGRPVAILQPLVADDDKLAVVAQITVVEPTDAIRARAALLEPVTLPSLDALHLATALEIGDDLDGLVTYDERMSIAAETLGLVVHASK
jgi:prevent-host-death family protein